MYQQCFATCSKAGKRVFDGRPLPGTSIWYDGGETVVTGKPTKVFTFQLFRSSNPFVCTEPVYFSAAVDIKASCAVQNAVLGVNFRGNARHGKRGV